MKLGIDVRTTDKQGLIRRLNRLVGTTSAVDGGSYAEDRNFSQVHVETDKTEAQLEDWLYNSVRNLDWVGVFELKAA